MAGKLQVAWIADPKKYGKKVGYPRPCVKDRLQSEGGWSYSRLTPEEIRNGELQRREFDVLVVPGGYAPNFADGLGERGSSRIRDFVMAGGGYVGICAGAYLGSRWGFDLLPVSILDIDHWDRGKTDACQLRKTLAGDRIAGTALPDRFSVRYSNGPLFEVLGDSVEVLLEFESDLRGKRGLYPPMMRDSPAVVGGPCGDGRVLLLSPHMEDSPELGDAFRKFIVWTSLGRSRQVASAFVPPLLYNNESVAPTHETADVPEIHQSSSFEVGAEAEVIARFRRFSAASDGTLSKDEFLGLLKRISSMGFNDGELAAVTTLADRNADGRVNLEELTSLVFGTSGIPECDTGVEESDGEEDAKMDVPALVRMQSRTQYEISDDGDGNFTPVDARDAPPSLPPPSLIRTCSTGCSGHQRAVSQDEIQSSIVAIQRAARIHTVASKPGVAKSKEPRAGPKSAPKAAPKVAPSRPTVALSTVQILNPTGPEYICSLGGQILITAPHSIKLNRGGGVTGERVRIHKREQWTAEITTIIARELQQCGLPASMIVWNRAARFAGGRSDPNYLLASQFSASPWHCALHRWALGAGEGLQKPLFHVDLHGKVSEKLHLDLGAAPLEAVWPLEDQPFVRALKTRLATSLFSAMQVFGVVSLKGKPIEVDVDPALHGFWGEDTFTTISHQSVLLGIPAVQFEMPPRLRRELVLNRQLAKHFAVAIADVYRDVVVPWWVARSSSRTPWPGTRRLSPELAVDVEEKGPLSGSKEFELWSDKLLTELMELEASSAEVQI